MFYEIAKYNLCNKAIKTIEGIEEIDQEKISANYFCESLSVTYHKSQNEFFNVFSSNLGQTKPFSKDASKPNLAIYEIISSVENQIENCEREIARLSNTSYGSDNQFAGYNLDDEPVFTPVYGGPNSRRYFDNQSKIESLKATMQSLKECGSVKEKVSNLVSSSLLADWDLKKDDRKMPVNKELILQLSWIDVYKKQK